MSTLIRWDQTIPPPSSHMREVTDGSWHGEVVSHPRGHQVCSPLDEDLRDSFDVSFVISVEEYQDATGTDNKESFSLEPCLLSTGLLKSEFNGDHRSHFIIGYIPSFLNRNPQQTNA
jgi:hypothetical protein